jgi:hypothetical protein
MITHIVLFKYKPDVDAGSRRDHVARLNAMVPAIADLVSFAAGLDVLRTDRSYDAGLVAVLRDRDALARYATHPAHVPVAEFGRAICSSIVAVDFERDQPEVSGHT